MKGESEKHKAKRKKLIITIVSLLSGAFVVILILILINAYVFPLEYLSTLVNLPKAYERQNGELAVHFVDVGQGDATVIEFPDGKTMLIDGGGEECTHLLRYIRALKIKKFDYLMLSHPDTDHCGGLDDVLKLYGAKEIFIPYCPNENINSAYFRFTSQIKKMAKEGITVHISQKYSLIHSENEENFYYAMVLSPLPEELDGSYYNDLCDSEITDEEVNDTSAVLYLEYAQTRFLFTGDIGERVESDIIKNCLVLGKDAYFYQTELNGVELALTPNLFNIDVLKISHHGSSKSSTEEFLQLVSPKHAVISVGKGNLYGHPSPTVISRITAANANCKILRTDVQGDIVITVTQKGETSFVGAVKKIVTYYRKKTLFGVDIND